jgi:hypothetical protein
LPRRQHQPGSLFLADDSAGLGAVLDTVGRLAGDSRLSGLAVPGTAFERLPDGFSLHFAGVGGSLPAAAVEQISVALPF